MRKLLTLLLLATLFVSCSSDDDNMDFISNDAQIYSFSLRDTDNIDSKINRINFAINQIESIIYNPDKLAKETKLDRIKLTISFNPIYNIKSLRIITPDSSFIWDKSNYIDLSRIPIYFEIIAPSGYTKKYSIDIRY